MDLSRYNSEIAEGLSRCPPPDFDTDNVDVERVQYDEYLKEVRGGTALSTQGVVIEEHTVESRVDSYLIPIRVYRPDGVGIRPGLVYIHGGAFYLGSLESEEERCICTARDADCVVLSVDYRLAPEHSFPVPLDDCYAAVCWVAAHADQLRIDSSRLGVGGCSAGGALAASVAQLCRDRAAPHLALQVLIYPVLDASLRELSIDELVSESDLEDMKMMWSRYLGDIDGDPPPYASPAACEAFEGLPQTLIVAAELDLLRGEALSFAGSLLRAGVSVEFHLLPQMPHAAELFVPGADISRRLIRQQAESIRKLFDSSIGVEVGS